MAPAMELSGIGAKLSLDAAAHINYADGLALEFLKLIVRQENIGEVVVVGQAGVLF